MSHGTALLASSIIVVLVLAGRPLIALRGRTVLTPDRIIAGRPPAERVSVRASQVTLVEVRRGLVMEWPVLHRWEGRPVVLGAPVRLWFRPDPVFDRDLDRLRIHAGYPATVVQHRWSMSRLVGGPLLTVAAVALVLIDPPWKSDVWPLRQHARRLPDTCQEFDARAHRLLPGAQVDRAFSHNDDSNVNIKRHTCQWNATHLGPDKARLIDVGRLSIEVELDHGIGPVSDAEEAHRTFARQSLIDEGESEAPLGGAGDEAYLITEHPGARLAWVTVTARKANVEERIELILEGSAKEREAAADVTGLARTEFGDIKFR